MESSFTGYLSTFSKLVVCVVMIMGRHRGLPHSLDAAGMNSYLVHAHAHTRTTYTYVYCPLLNVNIAFVCFM